MQAGDCPLLTRVDPYRAGAVILIQVADLWIENRLDSRYGWLRCSKIVRTCARIRTARGDRSPSSCWLHWWVSGWSRTSFTIIPPWRGAFLSANILPLAITDSGTDGSGN